MTSEPGREPSEWESVPRSTTQPTPAPQPVQYNSARHGNHVEESPELLRWRADLLMDEMMMGGVDVSAADGNRTFSGVDAPMVQRSQSPNNGTANGGYSNTAAPNSLSPNSSNPNSAPANGGYSNGSYPNSVDNGRTGNGGYENSWREETPPSEPGRGSYDRGGYERGSYDTGDDNSFDYGARGNGTNTNGGNAAGANAAGANGNGYYRTDEIRGRSESSGGYPSPASGYQPPAESSRSGSGSNGTTSNGPYANGQYPTNQQPSGPYQNGAGATGSYVDDAGKSAPADEEGQAWSGQSQSESNTPYSYEGSQLRSSPRSSDSMPPATTSDTAVGNRPENAPYDSRHDPRYDPRLEMDEASRAQSSNTSSPTQSAPPTRPPLPPVEPPRTSTAPARVTPPQPDQQTEWATGPDKWEYQDFAANPEEQEDDSLFSAYIPPERRATQESAVRSDPAQFVSAMSVVSSNKKRSTLLPRSTELDVDTLHREISDLHAEIALLLPVGNETSERARHLLDKAYSILQSDPSRSAEVEYYMQQVRTIVLRLHQARKWSDLYRQRLHLYLWAWVGLSAVAVMATFVFQSQLEEAVMWLFGVDADNWFVANWTTFLGTAFAGALGGALGALYTMQNHARAEYSFFDRKYGLRGLILPFMGLIVGALGYWLFGLVFILVGIDPSQSLTAAIVPMVSAFAFGFSQESIFGTRDMHYKLAKDHCQKIIDLRS